MKQKKSKGFTLMELLGVIVIIAIISVITIPIAIDLLSKARKEAYRDTGYGIIDAIKLDIDLDDLTKNSDYYIKEGKLLRENGTAVALKGTLKGSVGEAKQRNGSIYISIENDQWCLNNYNEKQELKIYEKQDKRCQEKINVDETIITITPDKNTLKIHITDPQGIMQVRYEINNQVEEKNYNANNVDKIIQLIPNEIYQIKVQVTNQMGKKTEKSFTYHSNSIPPELILPQKTQITSIEATSYNLRQNVIAHENNQLLEFQIKGELSPIPKDYIITYIAQDLLGNEIKKERNITVVKEEGPIISLDKISTNELYQPASNILLVVNHQVKIQKLTYQLTKDGVIQDQKIMKINNQKHIENYIPLIKSGNYQITISAIDQNENEYTLVSGIYFIDNNRPTIKLEKQFDQIIVTTQDLGNSGIKHYKYCYGINCTPTILHSDINISITIPEKKKNLPICVIALDHAGNESKKACIQGDK